MYISARERMILEILLTHIEEITVRQLSEELGVSERTIHRDLKGVEDILNKSGIHFSKKSGVGLSISGEKADLEHLQLMLHNQSPVEFTPEERQTIILCTLLESNDPVKLQSLSTDLNVTMVTVSNDLYKLEDFLEEFDLTLNKKRGYGVEILGSESNKRKAMRAVISENMDEVEFLSLVRESIQKQTLPTSDTISQKLLGLVEKQKLVIVEKVVEEATKERHYAIADSAYIGLVVHLALAIERIQQGENIKMDSTYLEVMKRATEFKIAERIVEKLATVFNLVIPEAEIGYITMHLQGAKLRQDKDYIIADKSIEASEKAKQLIRYVEKELEGDLSTNFSLYSGLVTHLEPALYRIEQKMRIQNPLLEKIKEDYHDLFSLIKKAVGQIFMGQKIPDEEVGFLVLHFGSALLTTSNAVQLKAIVICSTGIGTSKILATRMAREFPEIKTLKNVSLFELDQLNIEDFDLVISTVKLPDFGYPYSLVSPILTQEEITKLRAVIQEKRTKNALKVGAHAFNQTAQSLEDMTVTIKRLEDIQDETQMILELIKNYQVKPSNKGHIKEILQDVCSELESQSIIRDPLQVVTALMAREAVGGLGIPDSTLALFHTRHTSILKPVFLTLALSEPLTVMSMAQQSMEMNSVCLLLAPEQISNRQLEILSYISAMIIETKESLLLFETNNEVLIRGYLATKLNQFFWWKLTEMRD